MDRRQFVTHQCIIQVQYASVHHPSHLHTMPRRFGWRVLRLALLMLCLGLTLHQSLELLEQYRAEPTMTSFTKVPVQRMTLPLVTLCTKGGLFSYQKFPFNDTSVETWQRSNTKSLIEIAGSCAPNCYPTPKVFGVDQEFWRVPNGFWRSWIVDRSYTVCHTFTPNSSLAPRASAAEQADGAVSNNRRVKYNIFSLVLEHFQTGPFIELTGSAMYTDFDIFFHPRRAAHVTNPGFPSFLPDPKITVLYHFDMNVRLRSAITTKEPLRRAPCRDQPGYDRITCLTQCLYRLRASRFGCRTPQMKTAYPELPECRSPAAMDFSMTDEEELGCACPAACREHTYSVINQRRAWSPKEVEDVFGMWLSGVNVLASNMYPEMVVTERGRYPLVSFVSEVGGYVGLLLGMSALSLVQLLLDLVQKVVLWSHRNRVQPLGAPGFP